MHGAGGVSNARFHGEAEQVADAADVAAGDEHLF
jgi:hypothetical protein